MSETLKEKKARRRREREEREAQSLNDSNTVVAEQPESSPSVEVSEKGSADFTGSEESKEQAPSNSGGVSFNVSGGTVTFRSAYISPSDIKSKTYVDPVTNNRPQELLNESNLKALVGGLKRRGQLQPAYGVLNRQTGKIELLDGSRRSLGCEQANIDFWVYVCDPSDYEFDITVDDKIDIRRDLQTAKEQSLYDLGQECLAWEQKLGSAKAVAARFELSEAKISRAKKAASVSIDLISLFEDYNVLSLTDFTSLKKLQDEAEQGGISAKELADKIQIDASNNDEDELAQAKSMKASIKTFVENAKPSAPKTKITTYNYVKDKKTGARMSRKTEESASRKVTETFKMRDVPSEIVEKINKIMEDYAASLD
jgi:ParB family chromosome partitioning protein